VGPIEKGNRKFRWNRVQVVQLVERKFSVRVRPYEYIRSSYRLFAVCDRLKVSFLDANTGKTKNAVVRSRRFCAVSHRRGGSVHKELIVIHEGEDL
jgi:hypothetical protein